MVYFLKKKKPEEAKKVKKKKLQKITKAKVKHTNTNKGGGTKVNMMVTGGKWDDDER